MATTYRHDSSYAQRRMVVFVWIVAIHGFLIWAFASGLATRVVELVAKPIETNIIDEVKTDDVPPPPPPPELERPPVQVVAPEITINLTPDAPPPPIAAITTQPITPPPPRPPVASTSVKAVSIPNPDDLYPATARNAGQEGRPVVTVCVSEANKLESVELADSSSFPLLDEAAVKVAKGGRFKAATVEGKPVRQCVKLPIKFQLKKSS
jgi:periplasmic protein TonB